MTKIITLTGDQETVHKAIIELYEVDDHEGASAFDVAAKAGMIPHEAEQAITDLEKLGLVKRDEDGVITYADNNGYHPLSSK